MYILDFGPLSWSLALVLVLIINSGGNWVFGPAKLAVFRHIGN